MAKSEQQRQRKLAKKKAKELEGKKTLAQRQQQLASLAGKMAAAASGSVEHCYISSACHDETGIGSVVFVRRIGVGQLMAAIFLVDVYCLGVKDVVGRKFSPSEMQSVIEDMNSRSLLESVSPGVARGFVEAAVEYAKSCGLAPHSDYRKVSAIWGNIEPEPVPAKYRFGKNGKPHFIAGPFDDMLRQKRVVQALVANVGEGNFHFALAGPMDGAFSQLGQNSFDWLPQLAGDEDDVEHDDDPDSPDTIDGTVSRRLTTSE